MNTLKLWGPLPWGGYSNGDDLRVISHTDEAVPQALVDEHLKIVKDCSPEYALSIKTQDTLTVVNGDGYSFKVSPRHVLSKLGTEENSDGDTYVTVLCRDRYEALGVYNFKKQTLTLFLG